MYFCTITCMCFIFYTIITTKHVTQFVAKISNIERYSLCIYIVGSHKIVVKYRLDIKFPYLLFIYIHSELYTGTSVHEILRLKACSSSSFFGYHGNLFQHIANGYLCIILEK